MKKENAGATFLKTKNSVSWSRSHVHIKKSSGAGVVSFLRRLRSPACKESQSLLRRYAHSIIHLNKTLRKSKLRAAIKTTLKIMLWQWYFAVDNYFLTKNFSNIVLYGRAMPPIMFALRFKMFGTWKFPSEFNSAAKK